MAVVAFIDPPQGEVIEKILRGHQSGAEHSFASVPVGGLWRSSAPRAPPDVEGLVHQLDGCSWDSQRASSDQPQELTYVDMDTFLATF